MKVLIALDGTKQSSAAIENLRNLAISDGDEIKVLSVVDVGMPLGVDIYGGYLPDTTEMEKSAKEHAERYLETATQSIRTIFGNRKIEVTSETLFGSPESRIVETAEAMKPDLIVVGSHGYRAWERLLLGSVSDAVVHHAPCSVMVVRCPAEADAK